MTATLFAAEAPRRIYRRLSQSPDVMLHSVVDISTVVGNGSTLPNRGGFLIVPGPEHAAWWCRTRSRG